MKEAPALLGDAHNFGRRVARRDGRIVKPRTVFWEWLVLGATSPLRRALDGAAEREGHDAHMFSFLPRLTFHGAKARAGGDVDEVRLLPLPRLSNDGRRQLASVVGRSLALFSWLGVSDLHWENLVLGVGPRGQIVFAPLDVEMILADLSLPTETKLLPDPDPEYAAICRHAAGVRRVLPYLGKPVRVDDLLAMASAYHVTLAFLDRHARVIADTLAHISALREAPIRVCLRGTGDYVRARTEPVWPPLLEAESEQLARGDIPYFFRLYGRPGILSYADRSLRQVMRLPQRGDVPRLEGLLQVSRGLRSPARNRLREEGLFTVLGAFDHPSFSGEHRTKELSVTFGARTLTLRFANGEELRARRNLRAFVSSVYLPCRCGEVRSVFVPQVTRCEALGGS